MLYSPEELPESVFKSILSAPHARRIFTQAYDEMLRKGAISSRKKQDEDERTLKAAAAGWHAVKEAYGLSY
jgi:cation transport regulator ChaB